MLFQPPHEELTDEEIAAVLRDVIAGAGRLPRHVDVYLARASGGRPQGRWADRGAAGAVADAPVRRSLPVKVALSDCCRPNLTRRTRCDQAEAEDQGACRPAEVLVGINSSHCMISGVSDPRGRRQFI
jgi:hypothetical protein